MTGSSDRTRFAGRLPDSSPDRGQTEPLAALVSIAAICAALSIYAGVSTSVLENRGSQRDVSGATLDGVWGEVSDEGVVDANRTNFESEIDPTMLPQGRYVRVTVTVVGNDGRLDTVVSLVLDPDGTTTGTAAEIPDSASTARRPVPVRVADGDVRPGRLTVVVWQ